MSIGWKSSQHERERDAARGLGLPVHLDQVDAEREHAQRVVAAFTASPSAGVVSLDGRMLDRPHLLQAQRILAAAERGRGGT